MEQPTVQNGVLVTYIGLLRQCGQPLHPRCLACCTPQEVLGASGSSQAQQAPGPVHKQMFELLLWIQTLARETGTVVIFQYT